MEDREAVDERKSDQRAASKPAPEKQEPEQDGTDSTTFDTDQHSDAPGPHGTG
jgi:hypothetical protein